MANPTAPLDSTSAKMGFGIYLDGANDAPAWVRILDAAVVADETTKSGSVASAAVAATSGGMSAFKSLDIDETEEQVKGSAGQLYFIHAINTTNALLYLKFYDGTAAGIAVGSDTPVWTFPVPANNDLDGAGFVVSLATPLAFATGITVACTTAAADADTGAPGAGACIINLGYK